MSMAVIKIKKMSQFLGVFRVFLVSNSGNNICQQQIFGKRFAILTKKVNTF